MPGSRLMAFTSHNAPETQKLAAALAAVCAPGDCIALEGDLGSGKTTFARGFIRALQAAEEEVVSPTFTLAQTYPARQGFPVWHFDLYRLRHADELAAIGFEDALATGVTLVEWPALASQLLPPHTLHVAMDYGAAEDERRIGVSGNSATWKPRLEALKESAL